MHLLKVHKFFEWLSSGTAASALALFVYTASESTHNFLASALFLLAMPLLITATAISKEMSKRENSTKKAEFIHTLSLAFGLISFLGGLGALTYLVSPWLLGVFFISFSAALVLYQVASNSLLE